jgi:hypothetical protein
MINLYVLFADDEPDIREIIDLSLGLDPLFAARGVLATCRAGLRPLTASQFDRIAGATPAHAAVERASGFR